MKSLKSEIYYLDETDRMGWPGAPDFVAKLKIDIFWTISGPDFWVPSSYMERTGHIWTVEQPIIYIEVRDPRTGYLLPARDGSLPDVESSWDAASAAARPPGRPGPPARIPKVQVQTLRV